MFGALAAPRQAEAKLGAKLQCILTQTCSPPRVTGNGRQPEQICVDAVSVVARGSPRRQDVSRCGGRRAMDDPRPEHLDSFAETAASWHQIFNSAPTRAVAKVPRRPSLHISDRPARIGQSHLGRVDSASPLSTKAALGAAESWKLPSIPGAQLPSSRRVAATCRGACCEFARGINTSWPPPAAHAVPRRTSLPHHLQPRVNWTDRATRANQNTVTSSSLSSE